MIIKEEDYLQHYGILRKSGRYPWGSGGNVEQRSRSFLDYIKEMLGLGMTEAQVAAGLSSDDHPFTTTDLRALKTIARNEVKAADIAFAQRLKDKGWSNGAIAERMGLAGESSVRALLAPGASDRSDVLTSTSDMLKQEVDSRGMMDIGAGVENQLGVNKNSLNTAVAMLKEQGYPVHRLKIETTIGNQTEMKVLAPPGTTQREAWLNRDKINLSFTQFTDDGGRSWFGLKEPLDLDSNRIGIAYKEDGGAEADGVIYLRPGTEDLSLGGSNYAQVRIAVDGTHYLKGVAIYKDDLPPGVDVLFNTNKSKVGTTSKLDVMKPLERDSDGNIDKDNPFGSVIKRQIGKVDEKGDLKELTSVMNIVNEEGDWNEWSRTLSSQMLSKQSPTLAKNQLNVTYENTKSELDEIMALTNPAVKKKLLEGFAEGADSKSVHLKSAAIPRTFNRVILPVNSLKDNEIYSPSHRNGERVALIRHPHGGTFEIPELTVNNNHPTAKRVLGRATDAIGINSKVAERLSGADFDGDTVLVIPNNSGRVKSTPALEGLKNFDPKAAYPEYDGMPKMSSQTKQMQMGVVSNLITDMTIQGAPPTELARAVRHSMVVIDAERHNLNYKQSAIDNGIPQLKEKYQGSKRGGAATLISKAGSDLYIDQRKPRPASQGGPVDPATGRKMYVPTGRMKTDKYGNQVPKQQITKKLAEEIDAHKLVSANGGTVMEKVYADYSNKMKSLANTARKAAYHTENTGYSPSAAKTYSKEVKSLNAKLNVALKNAPLERQAQILANTVVKTKRQAYPNMDSDTLAKVKRQALDEARARTGAKKTLVKISDDEWNAIQAGAVSNSKLNSILQNSDLDRVKELATPKTQVLMTSSKQRRAEAMARAGYTQAEIADDLGVSLTTLKRGLSS